MLVGFEKVATTAQLPEGARLSVVCDGRAVLVFHAAGQFYAVEDICSHDGQPLTDGKLVGCAIECPRHGAKFDIRSGRALCMPAVEGIATFEVQVEGGDVWLRAN